MSFIDHKEKVFFKKNELHRRKTARKKSVHSLSFISPSTDPRAWSLDLSSQRSYFLDALYENVSVKGSVTSSSRSSMSTTSSNRVIKVKRKIKSFNKKNKLKHGEECESNSQEDGVKSLGVTRLTIKELTEKRKEAERAAQISKEEAENLRNLVKDVQHELSLARSLKLENLELRSALNFDLKNQFLEAQDEINSLSKQLDIFKRYQSQYNSLKEAYYRLKEEKNSLNLSLLKCTSNNRDLQREIEEYKGNTCREIYASNAIVDREVLRERIQSREEKIHFLVSFLEEQEMTINDLAIQLGRLTTNVSAKEMMLNKHMSTLRSTLDEKNARIIYLEEKLHTSELLIRELENLKEQLRLTNAVLWENMHNYKKQFSLVVSCSEKLLIDKEVFVKEITDKNAQIKKLSIFPQSPKTVVYLSQMLQILKKSEESASDETETIFSYVPSIRRIIEDMKTEVWNQESFDLLKELNSADTQTDRFVKDEFTQHEIFYYCCHKFVEANIPDKYYFENQNLKNDLLEMKNSVAHLEEAYFEKTSLNKELEKRLIKTMGEKTNKENEVMELQKEVELAREKLLALQSELKYNDALLNRALNEIDIERSVCESTSELLSASFDSTLLEYRDYTEVLEKYFAEFVDKIESLDNHINHEILSRDKFNDDYVSKLEAEVKRLAEINAIEKKNVDELNSHICILKKKMSDKKNQFKCIHDKLVKKTERLFEQIDKFGEHNLSQEMFEENIGEGEIDEIVVRTSNKILLYGEWLETHWKEEKSLREKLLKETYSHRYVENLMKTHETMNKKFKMRIKKLSNIVARSKKVLTKKTNNLIESEKMVCDHKLTIDELRTLNKKLMDEKNLADAQLHDKLKEMDDLKVELTTKNNDYETLKQEKDKMIKVFNKIIGNLEQSMSGQNKESIGTITDGQKAEELQIKSLTSKNNELSGVIAELQERLDSLQYVPEKENSSNDLDLVSVSVQTPIDWEKKKVEELEVHYKSNINTLLEKFAKEKRLLEEENAKKFEDYKRDLKLIMRSFQENLLTVQADQVQKSLALKSLHEKELQKLIKKQEADEISKTMELEKQKKHFENVLASKDEELNNAISELRIEIKNIISKKEDAICKIKEATNNHVNYIKKKDKKRINKVKNDLKVISNKYDELKKATYKAEICKTDISIQTHILNVKEQESQHDKIFQTESFDCFVQCNIEETKVNAESQTDCKELCDAEANTNDCFTNPEDGKHAIPEKMDHIIFGLPPNKNIDINFKESIKCSIKETKRTYIGDLFPSLDGSGDAPVRDVFYQWDKSDLISHVELLQNDLLQKTEDFNRNVLMYQETIRRQKSKIKELESSLNQETLQACHLQHRLGMEFTRAEQSLVECNGLREYCEALQKYIQDHEIESYSEREKYNNLKKRFDSIIYQRKQTDQLEESLKRLKEKLETAVEYEKRLTEEIQEDKKAKEKFQDMIKSHAVEENSHSIDCDKCLEKVVESDNNVAEGKKNIQSTNKSDLKVVFIQQCEFRRMWSRQILEKKYKTFRRNLI